MPSTGKRIAMFIGGLGLFLSPIAAFVAVMIGLPTDNGVPVFDPSFTALIGIVGIFMVIVGGELIRCGWVGQLPTGR